MMKEHEEMTFGKHIGVKLGDVPASYLIWFFEQPNAKITQPALFAYIKHNIRHLIKDANETRKVYHD